MEGNEYKKDCSRRSVGRIGEVERVGVGVVASWDECGMDWTEREKKLTMAGQ